MTEKFGTESKVSKTVDETYPQADLGEDTHKYKFLI